MNNALKHKKMVANCCLISEADEKIGKQAEPTVRRKSKMVNCESSP